MDNNLTYCLLDKYKLLIRRVGIPDNRLAGNATYRAAKVIRIAFWDNSLSLFLLYISIVFYKKQNKNGMMGRIWFFKLFLGRF